MTTGFYTPRLNSKRNVKGTQHQAAHVCPLPLGGNSTRCFGRSECIRFCLTGRCGVSYFPSLLPRELAL
jgi:hypothetical protein